MLSELLGSFVLCRSRRHRSVLARHLWNGPDCLFPGHMGPLPSGEVCLRYFSPAAGFHTPAFFFFNPETDFHWVKKRNSWVLLPPVVMQITFLFWFPLSLSPSFKSRNENWPMRHNLHCWSAFFHFHLGTIFKVGLHTDRIWGFLWKLFALQRFESSRNSCVIYPYRKSKSPPQRSTRATNFCCRHSCL